MKTTIPSLRVPARLLASRPAGLLRVPRNRAASLVISQQARLHSSDSLPKIAQASTWRAIMPKFMRNRESRDPKKNVAKSKEWNPATFFIIIFMLIGSEAIRMLMLKNDYAAYSRRTDAKIHLLKEIIEKIKKGETVDVEKLLGTGDEAKEREWEEVLREIEAEDSLWHKKAAARAKESASKTNVEHEPATDKPTKGGISSFIFSTKSPAKDKEDSVKDNSAPRTPGFY